MDAEAVTGAVAEVARLVAADGAELVLVAVDPVRLQVRLALRLEDASCADCVLGPDELARTVRDAIGRRVPGEFELLLDDPRRTA